MTEPREDFPYTTSDGTTRTVFLRSGIARTLTKLDGATVFHDAQGRDLAVQVQLDQEDEVEADEERQRAAEEDYHRGGAKW